MYKDGYVLSVLRRADNVPVREVDGKVHLPFDSEYVLRLRNRNLFECVCELFIDGRKVSNTGRFIVGPDSYMDIERFVDDSMKEGQRFKFVPLSDPKVNDPGERENGWIEARFYKVKSSFVFKVPPDFGKPERRRRMDSFPPVNNRRRWTDRNPWGGNGTTGFPVWDPAVYTSNGTEILGKAAGPLASGCSATLESCSLNNTKVSFCCDSQAGATVEGSKSYQEFINVSRDVDESCFSVVRLKIEGISKQEFEAFRTNYCSACGERVERRDNFCKKCGTRLK